MVNEKVKCTLSAAICHDAMTVGLLKIRNTGLRIAENAYVSTKVCRLVFRCLRKLKLTVS